MHDDAWLAFGNSMLLCCSLLLCVALCCSATVMGKALEEFFEEKLCRALLLSFGAVYLVYSPQDY